MDRMGEAHIRQDVLHDLVLLQFVAHCSHAAAAERTGDCLMSCEEFQVLDAWLAGEALVHHGVVDGPLQDHRCPDEGQADQEQHDVRWG
eukprot:3854149-Alexandrium_andersonii.AAC.1